MIFFELESEYVKNITKSFRTVLKEQYRPDRERKEYSDEGFVWS